MDRQVVDDILIVLASMKQSIDLNIVRSGQSDVRNRVRALYLTLEEISFDFRQAAYTGDDDPLDVLYQELRDLIDSPIFRQFSPIRYHSGRAMRVRQTRLDPKLAGGTISLGEALGLLLQSIERFLPQASFFDNADTFSARRIKAVVPREQYVAPAKFDVVDGILLVVKQPACPLEQDENNVFQAKEEITSRGDEIIRHLEMTNCDKRLLDSIKDIQDKVNSNSDIVRLGMANVGFEIICQRFEKELPDIVAAMLKSHALHINMYVAQFPEWHRFVTQAAEAKTSTDDIVKISGVLQRIIEEVNKNTEHVNENVPRTLFALNRLIANPAEASVKAVYAVWRSIENMIISVFNYGADLFEKSARKTSDSLSTAVSKVAVAALLALALSSAAGMAPLAAHFPDSAWISTAMNVVKNQLQKLD
ncbi:hypothetical protein [Sphingomonas crocodyli]|uniref:Uncharacterized protein n=1 Tax=Sphingomonas crocodyli TaxID=1979270 RepID=A0A437MAA1_9SPHN|nr:hypothetical protein [Sphingomonas crocodyli]RVT94562.1 hypothetical protein EOD43_12205 [Sphingomonas crocodyli]